MRQPDRKGKTNMTNYEMVELLRQKANVSYEEAKAALEASDWDLLDAIVLLEREGKVPENDARFSTKAESRMFRMWGADVINMSVSTETALANETGIPYAAVAMSTDYDCWKEDEAPVSWEEVSLVFKQNAEKVTTLLVESVPAIAQAALK